MCPVLFLSPLVISALKAASLLHNSALFHQECLHECCCLVFEAYRCGCSALSYTTCQGCQNVYGERFLWDFYHVKTEIAFWTMFCNYIESPCFHSGIQSDLDAIMENLATKMR